MDPLALNIEKSAWHKLDGVAYGYSQSDGIGNTDNWFGDFRHSLWAVYARIFGVALHYNRLHQWSGTYREPILVDEYDVTALLFCMASSLECITYALNILGREFLPNGFHNYRDPDIAWRIAHQDVTVDGTRWKGAISTYRLGYAPGFPKFQETWISAGSLIKEVFEYHNASKHRFEGFSGSGSYNTNPPLGYFERLGVTKGAGDEFKYSPWKELRVPPIPGKTHYEYESIERLAQSYSGLILRSGEAALQDAMHVLPTRSVSAFAT